MKAAVDGAHQPGLAPACGEQMHGLVVEKYPGTVWRPLCGGPPAQVEPMIPHWKPAAGVVRATDALYTPTSVPQGGLNAATYFQATMTEVLTGLIGKTCSVRVNDIVVWAMDAERGVSWPSTRQYFSKMKSNCVDVVFVRGDDSR